MTRPPLLKCDCKYGAPMGRCDYTPDAEQPIKMWLYKLKWVDGDYDEGSCYWGHSRGEHIYRACGRGHNGLNEMFIRTYSRERAKEKVLEVFPHARFYR